MCSRRFPRKSAPLRALLGLALLVGTGQARAQAASDAALCAQDAELLDVSVGGQARGVHEVRRGAGGTLLDGTALVDAEAGYVAREVTCDGQPFVRLRDELDVTYDSKALSLSVAARLSLLPGGTLDLAGMGAAGTPNAPVFGVAYALSASHAWAGGAGRDLLALDAYGALGRWSGFAGAVARRTVGETDGGVELQPRAALTSDLSPEWQVSAAYGTLPFTDPGRLSGADFWGVGVQGGNAQRRLERLSVPLPLDARVTVAVDGVPLATVDARAGELLLKNLPLDAGLSQVTVTVTDANGQRVLERAQDALPGALPRGAYGVQLIAGHQPEGLTVRGAGVYGLSERWTLDASAHWLPGDWSAQIGASSVREGRQFSASAQLAGDRLTGVSPGAAGQTPELTLRGSYAQVVGQLALGGSAEVPVQDPRRSRVTLSALGSWDNTTLFLRSSFAPGREAERWAVSAGGYRRLNERWTLSGLLQGQPGGWSAGLHLTWTPQANLTVSGGAGWSRTANAADEADSPASRAEGDFSVQYRPAPGHTLGASVGARTWQNSRLSYAYEGPASAEVNLTPRGADVSASGVVGLIGGSLIPGREAGNRNLLIRTGVRGVPLRVNGLPTVTDARGDALVALRSGERQVKVTVDSDDLPLNVAVTQDSAVLSVGGNGVATLNWQTNFEVSRWVRLYWKAGEVAAAADLHLDNAVLPADPDGYVLLGGRQNTAGARIASQDGTRSCPVTITPAEVTACMP